jgi:hypothetical protein
MICAGRGLPHALHFVDVICIFDCFGSETVMARKARTRWSFAEDRRLIQLAASLKSLEAVAAELKRTPQNDQKRIEVFSLSTHWSPCHKSYTAHLSNRLAVTLVIMRCGGRRGRSRRRNCEHR